jgi:hypothetical protein
VAELLEHWFNRLYRQGRRDVYLLRTPTGWRVVGREGGADGRQVRHDFDEEHEARRMVRALLDTVPAHLANWALMPRSPAR